MSDHEHEHDHMHEHEHHHEHDHDCHHGHDHHYDHEHEADEETLIDEDGLFASLLDHNGALVASYRLTLTCPLDEAKSRLSRFALDVSDAVNQQDGLVGHVKAFAREQGSSFRISVTADEPDIIDFPGESVLVEGVAIVMAVDKDWYRQFIADKIRGVLG